MIQFLDHTEIDKNWWDQQISECTHPLIYAKSWYLDAVSPNWGAALIEKNKGFVPLTTKRYFGLIPVWLQPLFCQQLGLFFKSGFKAEASVLKALTQPFFKTQFHQNAGFKLNEGTQKTNYILNLNDSYDALRKRYSKDAHKNLKKQVAFTILQPEFKETQFKTLRSAYIAQYGKVEKFNTKKSKGLKRLLFAAKANNALEYYEMRNTGNALLFTAAILKDEKRIYYLFAAPTKLGRSNSITHHFIDYIIETNAGSSLYLDFEGSMIPSVASFYKKWGVQEEHYMVYP